MTELTKTNTWISQRPVLLVGVGGTGCRIAEKIKRAAEENGSALSRRMAILGFDTDTADINRMRANNMEAVQLSSHSRVGEILDDPDMEDYLKWHPGTEELTWEYKNRDMLTGAGQIRLLSRLAFTENLTTKRSIDSALKSIQVKLFSAANTSYDPAPTGSVDVMVICSLAGGTGSGMFLPLSIYIRNWFESLELTTYFKGFFLLPGIYKNSSEVPREQHPNMDTNAYASLKELHSLVQSLTGRHTVPIGFSISKKVSPHLSTLKDRPFGLVSLFDDSSRGGQALGRNIAVYESMAADCAYQLLLTPIGPKSASTMDNNILTEIAAAAEKRSEFYMSMGTSGIVYPQESVERYLGLRYTLATMDDEWLLPEERFGNEVREFEINKAAGNTRIKRPKRFQSYIQSIESMAIQEEGRGFFSAIKAQVERSDAEEGQVLRSYDAYLASITEEVLSTFKDDPSLRDLFSDAFGGQSKDVFKRNLLKNVNTREMLFNSMESAIDERLLHEPRNTIASLWTVGEQSGDEGWKPHHLQYHILRDKLHPVAARYFLYKLKVQLAERLREAQNASSMFERKLDNLRKEFDDPDTKDFVETPVVRARELKSSTFFKELITRQKSRFVDDYLAYCDNRTSALQGKANAAVKEKLYEVLTYHVGAMIEVYEELFTAIEDLKDDLLEETEVEANAYGSPLQERDTYLYVLSSKLAKEALWERLSLTIQDEERAKEVYRSLGETLYGVYKDRTRERNRFERPVPTNFAELFQQKVRRDFCQALVREKYANEYQMCAVDAALLEAELEGREDPFAHVKMLVTRACQQSNPLTVLENEQIPRRIWATNQKNLDAFTSRSKAEEILVGGDHNTTILADDEFIDTRLTCSTFAVSLEAADFSKFAYNGEYQISYQARVDELLRQQYENPGKPTGVFTPHIDCNWHRPGVLPEITPEVEQSRQRLAMESLFLGYAQNLFVSKKVNRKDCIFFAGRNLCADDVNALRSALVATPEVGQHIRESIGQSDIANYLDGLTDSPNLLRAALLDMSADGGAGNALEILLAMAYRKIREQNPRLTTAGLQALFLKTYNYKASLSVLGDFTSREQDVRDMVIATIDSALKQFNLGLEREIAARSVQGKL